MGISGAPESSALYKQQCVSLCGWLTLFTLVNNLTEGIILSNHFPLHMASDKCKVWSGDLFWNLNREQRSFNEEWKLEWSLNVFHENVTKEQINL